MKLPICLALSLFAVVPGRAQIFGPNASGGLLLGGLAGGIIGYNDHHQTGRGIAIGAASGLLLGSMVDQANYNSSQATQVAGPSYYVYRQAPACYYPDCAEADCDYPQPNYAVSGALLGGLAGGIIGYNDHYQTGRGILIGAASGLLLGSIADEAVREREAASPVVVSAAVPPAPAPQNPPPPAVPASSNSAAPSPMSGADGLFGRN